MQAERNFKLGNKIAFSATAVATLLSYCVASISAKHGTSVEHTERIKEIIISIFNTAGSFSLFATITSTIILVIYLVLSGNRHPFIFPDVIERLRPEILSAQSPKKYFNKTVVSFLLAGCIVIFSLMNLGHIPSYFFESALISELLPDTEKSLLIFFSVLFFLLAFSLIFTLQVSLLAVVEMSFCRKRFLNYLMKNKKEC